MLANIKKSGTPLVNDQLSGVTEGSSQSNTWPAIHLEEFESAESAERTMSGHDENLAALPYRCM